MKFVIVQNNVGEMIATESNNTGNRIVHGTYEADNSQEALNKYLATTPVGHKNNDNTPKKAQTKSETVKLSESSSRMMILHIIHFLAFFGVNLHQQTKTMGTYFTTTSTSWEFMLNPTGIIAVLISWVACSIVGSILKRVTMLYNNSIE
jgi:hypothetical protein